MIVLDTDHMTALQWPGAPQTRLLSRLNVLPASEWSTTIVSYEEQTRGWLAYSAAARTLAKQVEAYRELRRHLRTYSRIHILDFDDLAAVEFQRLKSAKIRIGTMDLKIAAIALSRNAKLLTRNLSDFRQVPGLAAEDWTL